MEQDNNRITELTFKYASGEITPAEWEELQAFLAEHPERLARLKKRIDRENTREKLPMLRQWEAAGSESLEKTLRMLAGERVLGFRMARRALVAAAFLLILGGGFLYKMSLHRDLRPEHRVVPIAADIPPGGDKATLRLADGSVISLASAGSGTIAVQGRTRVLKTTPGSISYVASGYGIEENMQNTISTPRGGQFQVILPDGSRVWLNAATSLTYPTRFSGEKREVEVTGEAYFDVAKDLRRPFLVKAGDVAVTVLGTEFDISAYPDEPTKTTLVQGSVRVSHESRSLLLKPGQQGFVTGANLQIVQADTSSVVAWKNGDFRFRSAPIDEVMRQFSRWYDIEVQFTGEKPQQSLTAVVSRNLPASEVLKALEISGYHFKVVDRRIEVLP